MAGSTDNEQFVERFNAAMAEAGYPYERLVVGRNGKIYSANLDRVPWIPSAVVWQALKLAKMGDPHPCWSCWNAANMADPLGPDWEVGRWASDCVTSRRGGCHFPDGPAVPPRESLVRP